MQITLNETEILSALEVYVRSQINVADNQDLVFEFKAGRGDFGPSATLDIVPAGMPAAASKPAAAQPAPKANITATPEARKEPAVETKSNVAKPSFNIGKKPEPVAESQPEPEAEAEDEGSSLDDRGNSMTGDAETTEEAAPAPVAKSGIFSKVSG